MTLAICHPERSRAKSEAIRQTESKDPYGVVALESSKPNFRVVVRFYDDHDAELPSREAAAWESPTQNCRVIRQRGTESRRHVTLAATKFQ